MAGDEGDEGYGVAIVRKTVTFEDEVRQIRDALSRAHPGPETGPIGGRYLLRSRIVIVFDTLVQLAVRGSEVVAAEAEAERLSQVKVAGTVVRSSAPNKG